MYNITMLCIDIFYEEKCYDNTERRVTAEYTTGYVIGGYLCFKETVHGVCVIILAGTEFRKI